VITFWLWPVRRLLQREYLGGLHLGARRTHQRRLGRVGQRRLRRLGHLLLRLGAFWSAACANLQRSLRLADLFRQNPPRVE